MVGRNILDEIDFEKHEIFAPSSRILDLTNKNMVVDALDKFKPDFIIHAAGLVGGIQANIDNPVQFLERNALMGLNLVSSAYKQKVPNLINLASTCMYPKHGNNPLKETSILTGPLEPTNEGYALAKILVTRMCEYIVSENQDLNYKTLIPCNLYGKYDKFDERSAHLIPSVISKIHNAKVQGIKKIDIWGDGSARREFMYAGDLAKFINFAINNIEKLPQNMNVGYGRDYTVREYYDAIAEVVGWNGEFVYDTTKPVGMMQKLCDVSIQKKLGWTPETNLISGIKYTYFYHTSQR